MISSIILFAQTSGPEFAMELTQKAGAGEISFLSLFLKGGYILIPIVLLSFVAVYLIIKKYLDIRRTLFIDPGYVDHFNELLKSGDLKAASVHLQHDNSSYSNIFRHALPKIGKSSEEIESTLESASNIEVAKVSKHLGYLGLIAGIAPMLGFIGTISGIIKIFYNISLTDNISIGIISGGLYEKMISSGSGLIVGIIAFTGYHMLNMRIDRFISEVEEEAFVFMNIVNNK
ncbi:MAG TPA: MotA/TolQ/ExbB proton channel family protein [Bacteroidales bacterium]|jgi:biopolymer transport protein ExbB|nr:MotA/TolQ/ExbB proton channel family protein [Bacteroidales bacterium]